MERQEVWLDAVQSAKMVYDRSQFALKHDKIINYDIDEVSILFSDEKELLSFVDWATDSSRGQMEHFNSVRDTMVRQDEKEQFKVAFEFLRFVGAPWRIEAMCIMSGTAPLHRQHLEDYGDACIVHASFKTPSIDAYRQAKIDMDVMRGKMRAEYMNSYGIFSYFRYGDYYLKPRVNLRDR